MAHQMLNIIRNFGWIIAELNVKIFTVIAASFAVAYRKPEQILGLHDLSLWATGGAL